MAPSTTRAVQKAAAFQALASLPSRDEVGFGLVGIAARLDAIIQRAEGEGSLAIGIGGLKELRSTLMAQAQLAGHIGSGSTINVDVKNEINVDAAFIAEKIVAAVTASSDREAAVDRLAALVDAEDPR